MKTRVEIVDKMEELYKILRESKGDVNVAKIILAGDVLDWVIGDGDYLDPDEDGKIEWIQNI